MSEIQKYLDSSPQNVQYAEPTNISADFKLFVQQYVPRQSSAVSLYNLDDETPEEQKAVYIDYNVALFHRVWGRFSEPSYGPANHQLVRLISDGNAYLLQSFGLQESLLEHRLSEAKVFVNGKSLIIESNNGLTVSIVETNEPYNVGGGEQVATYKITVYKYEAILERVYAVKLFM